MPSLLKTQIHLTYKGMQMQNKTREINTRLSTKVNYNSLLILLVTIRLHVRILITVKTSALVFFGFMIYWSIEATTSSFITFQNLSATLELKRTEPCPYQFCT